MYHSKLISSIVLCFFICFSNPIISKTNDAVDINEISKSKPNVENYLKKLGLDFIEIEKDFYKVPVQIDNEVSIIYIIASRVIESIPETDCYYIFCYITSIEPTQNIPNALYKELARINYNISWGKISYDHENGNFLYSSAIWKGNLKMENLENEIYSAHYAMINYKETIENFINE